MLKRLQNTIALIVLVSFVFSTTIKSVENFQTEDRNFLPQDQTEDFKQMDYGKMPLIFEANKGQTDKAVKFISRSSGYTMYLTENEAQFSLKVESRESGAENEMTNPKTDRAKQKIKTETFKMKFSGANEAAKISGIDEAVTKTNYYISDKKYENLPNYKKVKYENLYGGIDAVFYSNAENRLEYDFLVAPNADANQIKLSFEGAENLSIDDGGNLKIKTANAEIIQQKPFAYQEINGEKREVAVSYKIEDQSPKTEDRISYEVSFSIGEYDKTQSLTIDPVLDYLTYIGGTAFDNAFEIAADAQGNAYITGSTASLTFHGEVRDSGDGTGVYAAKIDANGANFLYITILEGNADDFGLGIALDANNNAYLAGVATNDFPTTSGAFDTNHGSFNDADAFVTKLNSTGNIVYSTFLGGADHDQAFDVAVDSAGKAYVVGETYSTQYFPTKNRFQGCGVFFPQSLNSLDAFLTVFNASGSDITYSTCIGGNVTTDSAFSVAVDSSNNAYLTGFAAGGNFPTKNAAQAESGGGIDGWIAKFNPSQSGDDSLIYSTYIGGSGTENSLSIAVAANGTASITGITGSTNFPLKNAFDTTNQVSEAFVAQYNSSGALLNSSFLGGAAADQGIAVALGNGGTIYVTGDTLSNDFPTAVPFQAARRGVRDSFVAKIRFGINNNPGVSSASYIGGNGNDSGNGIAVRGAFIYVSGKTESNNLLTTNGVVKGTSNATATNPDGFVAKILDTRLETVGVFDTVNTVFNLKNTLSGGSPDIVVDRGIPGDTGVAGDFNGDGIDTVSTFNNGTWKIFNINNVVSGYPTSPLTANFGLAGDLPVVGDWDGDGVETIGTFRPSTGQFFLSNSNTTPAINFQIQFGQNGDLPVAGDWNGDGIDTVGVFRPGANTFFLTNQNVANPPIDFTSVFGIAEDLPVAGDFDGNGVDTISVWRPSTREFFISNDNVSVAAQFVFGQTGNTPVVGDWDGKPNQ